MGDILEFPSPRAQGMAYLEREMRKMLGNKGADSTLIDFATEQLTHIYGRISASEQHSFCVQLPDGLSDAQQASLHTAINSGLENLHRENHRLLLELIAQLLLVEVKLFQYERTE